MATCHGSIGPAIPEPTESVGAASAAKVRTVGEIGTDPDVGPVAGEDGGASHHLLIATTTGIAPIRSMFRDALGRGTRAHFTVLHGASRPSDLPYRSEFEQLAEESARITYVSTISRPGDPDSARWSGEVGRVERLAVRHTVGLDRSHACVYASGNAGMVANIDRHMRASGLRVRSEAF